MTEQRNTEAASRAAVELPVKMTVGELAEALDRTPVETVKELMRMGHMMSVNEMIDLNLSMQLAARWNIPIKKPSERASSVIGLDKNAFGDEPEDLQEKIPVITVVGHVDHGKTTLLDTIRESAVVKREAGGITQSVGAYQVERKGKTLTFIDTPGHEMFTAMRANGIQVTDIALLVVASDDGVMPQTIEAINHIKAASVPMIVVFTKKDLPAADSDRAKFQLAEHELMVEELGGKVQSISISSHDKKDIEELMEAILLLVEVEEFKANPNRPGIGAVVESTVDRTRGTLVTVLLRTGTLKQGDTVVAGQHYGHARALFDTQGKPVKSMGPGVPAQILGLSNVPDPGDQIEVVENDVAAREMTEVRKNVETRRGQGARSSTMEDMRRSSQASADVKVLNVIVKAKTNGAASAVCRTLETNHPAAMAIRILHSGVGAVNESDIMLASASGGLVVAFDTKVEPSAGKQAQKVSVPIKAYNVIYQLIEDIQTNFKELLEPTAREVVVGTAVVLQVFPFGKSNKIAGIRVSKGTMHKTMQVRVKRDGDEIYDGNITSMRHVKASVSSLAQGLEGGLTFEHFNTFQEDDVIECYEVRTD